MSDEAAAEVAEDYRRALEDLSGNLRYEISNLTLIARENTEHAMVIADVLQQHILKVAPSKKLPALYVLDSIVKNVGTPYTLYLGRGLYRTFMESYALVDYNTRRKMEEMLRTWKEPVPGSIDNRPVFPADLVRPIETALIRARTSALQAQQHLMQQQSQSQQLQPGQSPRPRILAPHRDTPTPPGLGQSSQFQTPPHVLSIPSASSNGILAGHPSLPLHTLLSSQQAVRNPGPYPHYINSEALSNGHAGHVFAHTSNSNLPPAGTGTVQTSPHGLAYMMAPHGSIPYTVPPGTGLPLGPVPTARLLAQTQRPAPGPLESASGVSIELLNQDIDSLVRATKAEFLKDPYHVSTQNKLSALLELQSLVQRQNLSQDHLALVRTQVAELSVTHRALETGRSPSGLTTDTTAEATARNANGLATIGPVASSTPSLSFRAAPPTPQQQHQLPGLTGSRTAATNTTTSIDSIFGKGALATLLASSGSGSGSGSSGSGGRPMPAPRPAAHHAPRHVLLPPPALRPPPPAQEPSVLLQQLRQAGLLHGAPPSAPAAAAATPMPMPTLTPGLAAVLAAQVQAQSQHRDRPTLLEEELAGVSLSSASLKQHWRPHLINLLYDDLGPPCSQCGRRFRTDTDGRRRKTAHMDWHFDVHQRVGIAEKRGQHRSWYVDTQDWIRSREVVDAGEESGEVGSGAADPAGETAAAPAAAAAAAAAAVYMAVPEAGSGVRAVCPICQEPFDNEWLDAAQEWVWLDAVLVGGRAFHSSCRAEAARDQLLHRQRGAGGAEGDVGWRGGSVESVLGKRKAEASPVR